MRNNDFLAGEVHVWGAILQFPVYLIGLIGWGVFVGIVGAVVVYLSFVVAALVVKFTK